LPPGNASTSARTAGSARSSTRRLPSSTWATDSTRTNRSPNCSANAASARIFARASARWSPCGSTIDAPRVPSERRDTTSRHDDEVGLERRPHSLVVLVGDPERGRRGAPRVPIPRLEPVPGEFCLDDRAFPVVEADRERPVRVREHVAAESRKVVTLRVLRVATMESYSDWTTCPNDEDRKGSPPWTKPRHRHPTSISRTRSSPARGFPSIRAPEPRKRQRVRRGQTFLKQADLAARSAALLEITRFTSRVTPRPSRHIGVCSPRR